MNAQQLPGWLSALARCLNTLVLQGNRPAFVRHAESHLTSVGLGEWIASSETELVAKAVFWNSNLQRLAELRARLRQQMAASPVCDTVGFTRDLERIYGQAWQEICELNNR